MTPKTSLTEKRTTKTTTQPRRLTVTFFMTLDGVVEDPAWLMRYWSDEIGRSRPRKSCTQVAFRWPGGLPSAEARLQL